jgi:ribonuclease P protein component
MRLASTEVKRLLGRGQRANESSGGITLSVRALSSERRREHHSQAGLALAVPKQHLKRSVDRNRAKRVLREAFRQHEIRAQPVDVLLTLSAFPKTLMPAARSRAASAHLRAAAVALFRKVIARQGRQ